MTKHEPIHTTRESFFDRENWSISKKGNPYIRDHGHTYTIKRGAEVGEMIIVAVRFDGERKDFGPYYSEQEVLDDLWPEGESAPKGVP